MHFNGPEETGQSIMNMDTNEITINRIIGFEWNEAGTDVEDELTTPISSLSSPSFGVTVPGVAVTGSGGASVCRCE